ncbi:MAG: DUF4430 domain-containing protein [Oscillospiraceae bacterium]|nr:DUF4430 domain-containing protein [Oscillospiraceae bacterium]
MKRKIKTIPALMLIIFIASITFTACRKEPDENAAKAVFRFELTAEDDSSQNSHSVEIIGDNIMEFTVKTNEKTVGAALLERGLIEGTVGEYGLLVTVVADISADYTKDKAYWAFYIDDEYATVGADSTEIEEGVVYAFIYTKD